MLNPRKSYLLFIDVKNVIGAFVKFNKQIQVPDEIIEQTLVKMIVDGFNDKGELKIMGRE